MISTPDLNRLRNTQHSATLYLSVFRPEIVYIGTVNGAHTRGTNQITVTNVSGDISNVESGMTVFIGTTQADYNVSRRRLRSRSGQVLTVDENSVVWEAGQYITVVRHWEFWPVFPYNDVDPPYTFYKDRDVTYTDQNDTPNPVAVMGSHKAMFLESVFVTANLDGSESYAITSGATISNYLWEATGGSIAAPTSATTSISFTSPGQYLVSLTVTDSNGKTQKTTRVYFVHERTGADAPYQDYNIQYIRGNWRSGGYSCLIDVRGDATVDDFPDRALIVIWSEQFFDGSEAYIDDVGNVLFAGYIVKDASTVDAQFDTDSVSFEAFTIDELMRRHENFSVSLTDHPDPTTWYQYKNLTIGRAIHHLWKWHSTLLRVCDVIIEPATITDYLMYACDDFTNGTLYAMADSFLFNNGNHSRVVCSKDGRVRVERDVNYLSDDDRGDITVQLELTERDRQPNTLVLERQHYRSVSFVMLTGTVYDGNVFTPIISKSPGEVPSTDGNRSLQMERQVFLSQQDGNERVGRVHAVADAVFRDLPIQFHGNYSFIDIVPQYWHVIDVVVGDTLRGYNLQNFRMLPRVVTMSYNSGVGVLITDVEYEAEATGEDGIAGRFPTELPEETPPEDYPEEGGIAPGIVATFDSTNGCHVLGSWLARNGNLPGSRIQDLHGHVDPWWQQKKQSTNAQKANLVKCGDGYIYFSQNRGLSWVNVTPSTNPPNDAADSPAPSATDLTYIQYDGNLFIESGHAFLANWNNGSENRAWIAYTDDDFGTWTWVSLFSSEGGATPGPGTPHTGSTYEKFGSSDVAYSNDGVATLTSSKFISVWRGNSGGDISKLWAVVGTIDSNNDITLGSFVEYTGDTDISSAYITRLTDSSALIVYYDSAANELRAVSVSVSGTTPTFSSTVNTILSSGDIVGLSSLGLLRHSITALTTGVVMIAVSTSNANSITGVWCAKLVVSGDVVTPSTWTQLDGGNISDFVRIATVNSTSAVVVFTRTNGGSLFSPSALRTAHSVVATIGTTVTYGTITTVWQSSTLQPSYAPDVCVVNGQACCVYNADTNAGGGADFDLYLVIGSIGSTVSWGSPVTVHTAGTSCPTVEPASNTTVAVVYPLSSTANIKIYTISGTTPTLDTTYTQSGTGSNLSASRFIDADGIIIQGYSEHLVSVGTGSGGGGSGAPYDNEGISISTCGEDGLTIYCTFFNQTDEMIYLRSYDLPDLTAVEIDPLEITACTLVQYNAKTFIAYVKCFRDYYDHILLFGRFDYDGVSHVMESLDAGATFTEIINDWGTNYASAGYISIYDRVFVVRDNGSAGILYSGNPLAQNLTFPFRIQFGGIDVKKNGLHVLVGGLEDAAGVMVGYSSSPFTTFVDITDDHPVDGSITSTVFLK